MIRYALQTIRQPRGRYGKLVVFVTSNDRADGLVGRLPALLGHGATFVISAATSPEQAFQSVSAFQELTRPAVLVLDRAGEAGLNLQFADAVLHLDLPTS